MPCGKFNGTVRNILVISDNIQANFYFTPYRCSDNVLFLDAVRDEESKRYVAVRIANKPTIKQRKSPNRPLLFTFQHDNGCYYVAFEDRHSKSRNPSAENNLDCLKVVLETLADYQAEALVNQKDPIQTNTFPIRKLSERVISRYCLKQFDRNILESAITRLEIELNQCLDDDFLIRSIGCPVNKNINNISLDAEENVMMPPVYDALLYIFSLSDEKIRTHYFVELVQYYFKMLSISLENIKKDSSTKITREYKETTVQLLLPVVKFQLVFRADSAEDLLENTVRFLKYPLMNQEDIYEILQNIYQLNSEYDLIDYAMKCLDENNGHLGVYYHLKIIVRVDAEEKTLPLFAKILLPAQEMMKNIVRDGPGEKEDFFYSTLLPLFKNNGLEGLTNFAPKCYLSRINWMLVLEDMMKDGYTTVKFNRNLNYEELKIVISLLAKFGAATLILEERLSDEQGRKVQMGELYPEKFKETILLYEERNNMKNLFDVTIDAIHYLIELFPEVSDNSGLSRDEIFKRTDNLFMSIFHKIHTSDKYRNVINHGDLHLGNILVHRGDDGVINKAVLVDFQIMRYMPPAFDLLVVIYLNSDRDTRQKYFHQLIEGYYAEVSSYLEKFGYDPEEIFPKSSFEENLEYMRSASLSLTLLYNHFMKVDPNIREDLFKDSKKFDYYFTTNKRAYIDLVWTDENYRRSMKEYITDVIDYITHE